MSLRLIQKDIGLLRQRTRELHDTLAGVQYTLSVSHEAIDVQTIGELRAKIAELLNDSEKRDRALVMLDKRVEGVFRTAATLTRDMYTNVVGESLDYAKDASHETRSTRDSFESMREPRGFTRSGDSVATEPRD